MQDEIISIYEKEEEIQKIIQPLTNITLDDLIKTPHFEYSQAEKSTDVNLLKQTFQEFNRIKLINKRKHKNDKTSYDIYYELDDKTYVLYAIAFNESKPKLLNAYHVQRNFRKFKQKLINAYKDKLT